VFSQLQILPKPRTRYTFRAYLLTSLSQAAKGKHFSPIYLFGLATRPPHRADLQHNRALSLTRTLLAMRFRQCHFSRPYICSLTDTSLPRSNLKICLFISAWHAILLMPIVCSLWSLHPVPKCSVAATTSYSTSGCQGRPLLFMAISSINIVSLPVNLPQGFESYSLQLLCSYA
jgi:hypothetical protein